MNNPIKKFVLLLFLFSCAFITKGQNNCDNLIDTFQIHFNQNLDGFLYKLQTDKFFGYTDKNKIPSFLKETLNCLTDGDFSLANPSEDYRCCCTSSPKLPKRKLVYLCRSKNMFAISYYTGGVGQELHLVLISFIDEVILNIWAGSSFQNLNNKENIIKYLKQQRAKKFNHFEYL